MSKTFFFIALIFVLASARAQDAKQYYDEGLEMAKQGKAEEAIQLFDKSIALKPDEYVAWYNRGIAKLMIHRYEDALFDFDKTIILSPGYKKAYLNRGTTRKHLTDYEGAMKDYDYVIKYDSVNPEIYYYRALLYNLLGKRIQACMDFDRSRRLGYKNAQAEMESCIRRPTAGDTSIHSILHLSKTADSDLYGFTPEHPIRVGSGPEGGPDNIRTYLELLRDSNGKPLKYMRIGSCCSYESAHALFGKQALEEKYQIVYTVPDGSEKKALIYLSFYDYEEPLIPAGMKTVSRPK